VLADSGLFELRRQLEYKAKWYDRDILIMDRFAPA
jgi:putative transposase